jgi:hypothetical protein
MPTKLLKMYIKKCNECPFCQYDDGPVRGWDCMNEGTTEMRLRDEDDMHVPRVEIPKWCPLDTADTPSK